MKKLLLSLFIASLFSCTFTSNTFVNNSLEQRKIETVTNMYLYTKIVGVDNHNDALSRFATPDFKEIIKKAQKHDSAIDDPDSLCIGGYEGIFGGGQDNDTDVNKIKYKIWGDKVRATFKQFEHSQELIHVDYTLKCDDKKCLISDLTEYYEGKGSQFKNMLMQCVKN